MSAQHVIIKIESQMPLGGNWENTPVESRTKRALTQEEVIN